MELEFTRNIFEKYSTIKFRKNTFSGAELFHADRRTDVTNLVFAFHSFANAPNTIDVTLLRTVCDSLLLLLYHNSVLTIKISSIYVDNTVN
jgi:hypothetical protein